MKRYVAHWCVHPPVDAEVDDGPDWRTAEYDHFEVALFCARNHGKNGPHPDGWSVTEVRWSPARSVSRSGGWVKTGRVWNATSDRGAVA